MIKQLEDLRDTLFEFIETRIGLFKIETRERIEGIILYAIYGAAIAIISSILMIFSLIILAIYLNERLQSPYWGFVIVGGFFLLMLVVLLIFRKGCLNLIRSVLETVMQAKDEK